MSFTLQVLVGLVSGLGLGIAASVTGWPVLGGVTAAAEPVGVLFINAIRMTVIPLVSASLMAGAAGVRDARAVSRIGLRALAFFILALGAAAGFAAAAGYPLLNGLHIDTTVAAALRADVTPASVGAQAAPGPTWSDWLVSLVPANPIRAAADGAILPLIVFSIGFGLALAQVREPARTTMTGVLQAIADAMLTLVGWVLRLAPVGVFALAVPLGAKMGIGAAGALVYYIAVMSGISAAFIVGLYAAGVVLGRQPLGIFVRASAPAVAVAFTSRSSLAALPAAIEAVRGPLKLPDEMASFFLPLSASMFRVGAVIAQVVGVLFVVQLYQLPLAPAQLGTIVASSVLTSLTVPGIPAGAIIVIAPVLTSVGAPVEAVGLLIGVDTIPDMFRTTANVVGWLVGACVLGKNRDRGPGTRDRTA